MSEIVLPNDKDIEVAVLGTLLTCNAAFMEVQDVLTEDCFYQEKYKTIYKAIKRIIDRGDEASILNVPREVKKDGIEVYEVAEIGTHGIYTKVRQYAEILADLNQRRQLWYLSQDLASKSVSDEAIPTIVERLQDGISKVQGELSPTTIDLNDGMRMIYDLVSANTNGTATTQGTLTGFQYIDKKGGLHPSDLVIIAGESSHGKTSFATSITLNAVLNGSRVAFYSMEMTAQQMMARMTAIRSGVSANHILYNPLSTTEIAQTDRAIAEIMNASGNLYIDDRSTSNIDTIISSIRTNKIRNNIDGAVVDYLQILNVNMRNTNKEQAMGDVARRLKNLAKDLGIWVIALSQLNRADGEPNINRLRDSGQIAEAADVVMLVYRPEKNGVARYSAPFENVDIKGTALIDVAKGRNIGVGKFVCGFRGETTHFYNLDSMPTLQQDNKVQMPF